MENFNWQRVIILAAVINFVEKNGHFSSNLSSRQAYIRLRVKGMELTKKERDALVRMDAR